MTIFMTCSLFIGRDYSVRVSDTAPRASINLNESDADVWHWPSDGRIAEDLKVQA